MIIGTSPCPNIASTLHRPDPIGDGFTLRCNHLVSCPRVTKKIRRASTDIGHHVTFTIRSRTLITAPSRSVHLQIPIALCSLP
jgi:hypothetical protein